MRKIVIGGHVISDEQPFIIAEIGSNHMGSIETCENLIRMAAKCGVDAVKLQKRDNAAMFTKAALMQPYNNENSLGATYGEHRARLDWFGADEFSRFKALCGDLGIIFFATAFDMPSADFLDALGVPCYKIASCDLSNLPLLRHVAAKGKPMIISTGGASLAEIQRAHDALHAIDFTNFAFLHCVSTYPNRDSEINLRFIETLRETFKHHVIGFSSHHPGVLPNFLAYREGARIFEVHITLNRALPGTDHAFSLEKKALETLCEDLWRVEAMIGSGTKEVMEQEKQGFVRKMGKAVRAAHSIPAGHGIAECDLVLKAPAEGIPPWEMENVIGKIAVHDLSTAEPLEWEAIK
jgi:N-acetylneuraminate synthase/sialic acid synthase